MPSPRSSNRLPSNEVQTQPNPGKLHYEAVAIDSFLKPGMELKLKAGQFTALRHRSGRWLRLRKAYLSRASIPNHAHDFPFCFVLAEIPRAIVRHAFWQNRQRCFYPPDVPRRGTFDQRATLPGRNRYQELDKGEFGARLREPVMWAVFVALALQMYKVQPREASQVSAGKYFNGTLIARHANTQEAEESRAWLKGSKMI